MALNINPTRRSAEMGFAVALLAAAVGAFLLAEGYPDASGAYPRTLSVLLGIGAALVMLRTARSTTSDRTRLFDNAPRFVLGFVALAVYIVAIDLLGYILPSFVFGVGLPMLLGYRNLRLLVPVVLGVIAFVLLVFVAALERPLPPDVLDPILEVLL